MEELIAANPTVNPRIMSIGTTLNIPQSKTPQPTLAAPSDGPIQTPTAMPVETKPIACTPTQEGGIWCFQLVHNPNDFPLESVTGEFRLREGPAQEVLSQTAHMLLDTLPAGASLPLMAYFDPDAAAGLGDAWQASSEIIAALPNPVDGRYVPGRIANQKALISADGLSAEVSLDISLAQPDSSARRVWVAATAYDAGGNVVGARRWEMAGAEPLQSGETLQVKMNVYSISRAIERVECMTELRP